MSNFCKQKRKPNKRYLSALDLLSFKSEKSRRARAPTNNISRQAKLNMDYQWDHTMPSGEVINRRIKVYLASYVPPNNPAGDKILLACKVVDTTKAPRDFVKKFLPRELDVLMRIKHPHIVKIHAIYQRNARYLIFMRLAENGDLLDWVVRFGPLGEDQSRVWLRQLTLAVQYLQALDLAHRDLKCENILITANCNCKLADFGFARSVVDSRGRRILCATNCGSLSYAAPEILGGNPYDPRISDIWSLGVVLFIMLNKCMPFNDDSVHRLYNEQIHQRWKYCSSVVLSEQVQRLFHHIMEPDPQRRYVVGQILSSDWLAMDHRLAGQSLAETNAISAALRDRELRMARQQDGIQPQTIKLNVGPGTIYSGEDGDDRADLSSSATPSLSRLQVNNLRREQGGLIRREVQLSTHRYETAPDETHEYAEEQTEQNHETSLHEQDQLEMKETPVEQDRAEAEQENEPYEEQAGGLHKGHSEETQVTVWKAGEGSDEKSEHKGFEDGELAQDAEEMDRRFSGLAQDTIKRAEDEGSDKK